MAFEVSSLSGRYDLVDLGVAQGTQISSRTSAVVTKLTASAGDGAGNAGPTVVALTAASKAAGKLISIVEIAKRELASRSVKVFQYNALSSRMSDIPRRKASVEDGDADGKDADSDDAFEVMDQAKGGLTKKRNVPVMTIYLSTVSVKELKLAFGHESVKSTATVSGGRHIW